MTSSDAACTANVEVPGGDVRADASPAESAISSNVEMLRKPLRCYRHIDDELMRILPRHSGVHTPPYHGGLGDHETLTGVSMWVATWPAASGRCVEVTPCC